MNLRIPLAIAVFSVMANLANAGLVMKLGANASNLLPNTANQAVDILINYDGSNPTPIFGANMRFTIGNGLASGAEFTFSGTPGSTSSVSIQDGAGGLNYLFDNTAAAVLVSGTGIPRSASELQLGSFNVNFLSPSNNIQPAVGDSIFARVLVNTTGFSEGSFAFSFNTGAPDGPGISTLIGSTGSALTSGVTFENGNLSITAVPEPSSIAFGGILGGAFLFHQWRRRNKKKIAAAKV